MTDRFASAVRCFRPPGSLGWGVGRLTAQQGDVRIFEALINPAKRVEWWGATGSFQITHMESDLRPGDTWAMRGLRVNGEPFTITGEYREITPPHLPVFTWLPDWQESASTSLVRIDLEEKDGVTTVRVTHSGLTGDAARTSHRGWPQILEWLRVYVEGVDGGATASHHEKSD